MRKAYLAEVLSFLGGATLWWAEWTVESTQLLLSPG
jgi:hypothetical protein